MRKNIMKKCICLCMTIIMILSFSACDVANDNNQEPVTTSTPEPVVENRVSFLGVGDNLIHNSVYLQADGNAPGAEYDFKPMYEKVADDIALADIAYINQETILGGVELGVSSYPLFNSPQEVGRDMAELGFDVFSHATNHAFDKGEKGLANTYAFYQQNPELTCIGLYKQGEDEIKIIEKEDIKIAFLNYTYTTNGLSLPQNSEYYVPIADWRNGCKDMIEKIKIAKEMSDFVVLCVHWGEENQSVPNEIQKESAKLFADAGCDVIVGTHPHTIQPIEYIGNTLVVYSLGNFISAMNNPVNMIGGMICFDFVKKGDNKKIENVILHPLVNHFNYSYRDIKIIPFKEYTPELAASHGVNVSMDYFNNLINKTVSGEFLAKE